MDVQFHLEIAQTLITMCSRYKNTLDFKGTVLKKKISVTLYIDYLLKC